MMKDIFDRELELSHRILDELESPNWNDKCRVMNWKDYVDDDFKKIWSQLTYREKLIVAFYAEKLTSLEEWD